MLIEQIPNFPGANFLVPNRSVRDFHEKRRQKETLKTPKKLVNFPSKRSTYSKFHNEDRANCAFQKVPAVKCFQKKNMF